MSARWNELAEHLAGALRVEGGSRVSVFLTDQSAQDAALALVEAVYARGGVAQVVLSDEAFDRSALRHASVDVLSTPAPLEVAALEWSDVHVSLRGMAIPDDAEPDPERLAALRTGKGAISTLRWQRTRWAIVRVPTPGWAAMIGQPYKLLLEQFFAGCLADWPPLRRGWDALAERLTGTQEVRITSADTDLTFRTTGRRWVTFAGEANFPDGELATAPLDDSAQGHIAFPGTFWFAGTAVTDLRLVFDQGRVVELEAARGQAFAEAMLRSDPGASRVGELGIGLNPALTTMTGDLFFDEKVLGTIHLALGRAYPECGGVNESRVHWDIVKDLRASTGEGGAGSLACDDLVLIENGVPTSLLSTGPSEGDPS